MAIDFIARGLAMQARVTLDPYIAPVSIDRSVTALAGSQLLVGTNPDRVALTISNPSDTAMAISVKPIAGATAAGSILLGVGATVALDPAPKGDVFLYGVAGKSVTVTDTLAAPAVGKTSSRTIGASNRYALPEQAATATTAGTTYRVEYWARSDGDIFDPQPTYAGWWYFSAETAFSGDLYITGSIEYPVGVFTQMRFGGAVKGTLPAGGNLTADTVKVRIPAGEKFWVRTWVASITGTTGFAISTFANSDLRDGAAFGGDGTVTGTSSFSPVSSVFGPVLIAATTTAKNPRSVVMFVDSIGRGLGDTGLADTRGNSGWPAKLLDSVNSGAITTTKIGRNGATISAMVGTAASYDTSTVRLADLLKRANFTHSLVQISTNDIASGATAASAIEAAGRLRNLTGAIPMTIGTLVPNTSGTWTTVAGQTLATFSGVLTAYNNTARGFAGVSFNVIDASDSVSSARDSGYWAASNPALTADGVHPSTTAVNLIINDANARSAAAKIVVG